MNNLVCQSPQKKKYLRIVENNKERNGPFLQLVHKYML